MNSAIEHLFCIFDPLRNDRFFESRWVSDFIVAPVGICPIVVVAIGFFNRRCAIADLRRSYVTILEHPTISRLGEFRKPLIHLTLNIICGKHAFEHIVRLCVFEIVNR